SRFAKPSIVPDVSELGLAFHTGPMFRNFITEDSRVASFCSWPDTISQKPKALAEAGFFYKNLSDHVMCFHCGGGLRNWRDAADPWTEHAKHYPQCNFVILMDNHKPEKKEPAVPDSQIPAVNDPKHSGGVSTDSLRKISTDSLRKISNDHICKICLDGPLEVVFLPCTHLATCASCATTQSRCPVCRADIQHVVKIKIP
ncbi:unnamed protein product, partial [Meganyctiphanes norvegica]